MRTARPLVTCSRITLCGAVGQLAVDFDPAIDRARMHDQAVGLEQLAALFRQAKESNVFAESRENILFAAVRAESAAD